MPRRTTKTTTRKSKVKKAESRSAAITSFNLNNLSRSYTSLIYGVITVIVLFALLFAGVKLFTQHKTPSIADEGINTTAENTEATNQYVVKEGDTLWSIAESEMGSGFAWQALAKANNITGSDIEKGQKLTIPENNETAMNTASESANTTVAPTEAPTATPTVIAKVSPTTQPSQQVPATGAEISGSTYTVQRGDTLWDISVRAYGDGYHWTQIAQLNNLADPNLIFSGNKLQLPR